jgi:hypothetical protein
LRHRVNVRRQPRVPAEQSSPRTDLRVRQRLAGEPSDLPHLAGQIVARVDRPLARLVDCGSQLDGAANTSGAPRGRSRWENPGQDTGAISHDDAHSGWVFVELDTRQDAGYTISLEWDRDTDNTRVVVADRQTASLFVLPVPGANAGDAFRHPFRYAP